MITQVKGISQYSNFIQMAEYSALLSTTLLAVVTSNLLLWKNSIAYGLAAVAHNLLAAFFGLLLLRSFMKIIVKKQSGERILYHDDDNYKEAFKSKKKSMSFWQKISSVVRQSFVILIDSLLLSVLTS
jgi:hypothetical protein